MLIHFFDNLYPSWGERCWHIFHVAEIWDSYILSRVGRSLGIRGRIGCHWNQRNFLHRQWKIPIPKYCTQFEIPLHFQNHQSGIWNKLVVFRYYIIRLIVSVLTSSTSGSGWTECEQGPLCHIGFLLEVNHQMGHLWFLHNQTDMSYPFRCPCWENSTEWLCQWAER